MTVAVDTTLVPLPPPPIPPGPPAVTWAPTLPPTTCTPVPVPDILSYIFGGGQMNLPRIPRAPDPLDLMATGLREFGLQFNPIAPGIVTMKAAAALVNLAKNMPTDVAQAIAFNPSPLITDVTTVISASTDLVALSIFPLQLMRMVRSGLQLLIGYLQALKSTLTRLIARYTNVNALIAKATAMGNAALLANATCAKERLDAKVSALNDLITSIGIALVLLGYIYCLVTGSHLPGGPGSLDASALVDTVFDPLIATLQAILALLPDLSGFALNC